MKQELRVGVVGYCPPTKFDETEARRMLKEAYDSINTDFPGREIAIVSGLTNVGVLKLAYEEAKTRGWRTAGVACSKAAEFPCFPVDEKVIVGNEWGDESQTFVNSIDVLVRVGGGKQSLREAEIIRQQGKRTYEYELPVIK
jgi:hypothetical protein